MPKCSPIKIKNRRICAGDLKDQIVIQLRTIKAPQSGSVDFDEEFTTSATVWAAIETRSGIEQFDGVNLISRPSHFIYIRYTADIDVEKWITYNGKRYEILDAENLEERDEFYLLRCSPLGDKTLQANFSR